MSYLVIVTYGTSPNMTFCDVPSLDSAEKLKALAIEKGYSDARIVEKEEWRKKMRARDSRGPQGPRS